MTTTSRTSRSNVIESRNPATGEVIGSVRVNDEAEVREAVQRARKAFETWSTLGPRERARQLGRVQSVLAAEAGSVAERIAAETGKPRLEALLSEVFASCELLKALRREAPRVLAPKSVDTGLLKTKRAWKVYEPYGVVGVISPWNFPFTLTMAPLLTALAAGNTVVLKPSEVTPLVGEIVAEVFETADVHPDVLQVVQGAGETGAALVRAGVDKIAFTGATSTGKKIMAAAAETLTPVVMELGGKDPMVVCADADLERAANGAVWGAFTNSGQVCMSTERVYVPESVYDEFVAKVVDKTRKLRQGVESDENPIDVGAMIFPAQIPIVERHVADARAKGAKILTGGASREDLPGDFFEPTVLSDCDHSMEIMREETFGPVLPIMKVKDEDEAVRLANDSRYGLTATVWTSSKAKGELLAQRLRTGNVLINDTMIGYGIATLPFGGVKESGFGRVHGVEGILEFVRVKSMLEDRLGLKREPMWFPYPKGAFDMGARLIGAVYREGLPGKVRSLLGR